MNKLIKYFNEKYGKKYGKISYPRTTLQIYQVYQIIKDCDIKDNELQTFLQEIKLPKPKTIEEREMYSECFGEIGILDSEYNTLTTTDKTIIGGINELNSQFKDIAKQTITTNQNKINIENYQNCKPKFGYNFVIEKWDSSLQKDREITIDEAKNRVNDLINAKISNVLIPFVIKYDEVSKTISYFNDLSKLGEIIDILKSKNININGIKVHIYGVTERHISFATSEDRTLFFKIYKSKLLEIGALCVEKGVTRIGIANELRNLTKIADNWNDLNSSIKNLGLTTFCCTTIHEVYNNKIYEVVDEIGINMYPGISSKGLLTTRLDAQKGWYNDLSYGYDFVKVIKYLSTFKKKVYITEVGCTNAIDTLLEPSLTPSEGVEKNNLIQTIFYTSVFDILGSNDIIDTFYFWGTEGLFSPFVNNNVECIELIKKYNGGGNNEK